MATSTISPVWGSCTVDLRCAICGKGLALTTYTSVNLNEGPCEIKVWPCSHVLGVENVPTPEQRDCWQAKQRGRIVESEDQ